MNRPQIRFQILIKVNCALNAADDVLSQFENIKTDYHKLNENVSNIIIKSLSTNENTTQNKTTPLKSTGGVISVHNNQTTFDIKTTFN